MKILRLTWFHLKRILFQNWGYLILTLGMPLIIIIFFQFVMGSDASLMSEQGSIVINHSDYVTEEIKPNLASIYEDSFVENPEEAFEQLEQVEVTMVYEIPEDFPNTENIEVYSLNGTNHDPIFEAEFTSTLTEAMTSNLYEDAEINFESVEVAQPEVLSPLVELDSDLIFITFMMLFFMGYNSGFIAGDLAKMRKEDLLTRSIISNTYSWQILGSVLAAYTIYSIVSSIGVILFTSLLFNVSLTHFGFMLSLIIATAIFVAGLTMLLFRIFKNENLIQILGILIIMILVFIPLFADSLGSFSFIEYLSPYYWIFEAFDMVQIFPNVLIIALYGLVLFTAGSFKIERLVKN
jgi:ABC-type multidrug transport system permease subunit